MRPIRPWENDTPAVTEARTADLREALSRLRDDHGVPCLCGDPEVPECPAHVDADTEGTPDVPDAAMRWPPAPEPHNDCDEHAHAPTG